MVERFGITIPKLSGKEERTAYVYLPVGYEQESERRYPVMYMFDGHNLFTDEEATFGKCWGLADYLDYTNTQIIIAAVECNTFGNKRLEEYSPFDFEMHDGTKIKGRGKTYMDWLTKSFKPLIDENYPTLPDRENTSIAGSSMGGLMSLYALCKYGKVFSKAAALSPSLWTNGEQITELIRKSKILKDSVLYMDYGSLEFGNHFSQRSFFANAANELILKGINVTARIVKDGTHTEGSWERQMPIMFPTLGYFGEE